VAARSPAARSGGSVWGGAAVGWRLGLVSGLGRRLGPRGSAGGGGRGPGRGPASAVLGAAARSRSSGADWRPDSGGDLRRARGRGCTAALFTQARRLRRAAQCLCECGGRNSSNPSSQTCDAAQLPPCHRRASRLGGRRYQPGPICKRSGRRSNRSTSRRRAKDSRRGSGPQAYSPGSTRSEIMRRNVGRNAANRPVRPRSFTLSPTRD
jgi:hypothetical protein